MRPQFVVSGGVRGVPLAPSLELNVGDNNDKSEPVHVRDTVASTWYRFVVIDGIILFDQHFQICRSLRIDRRQASAASSEQ